MTWCARHPVFCMQQKNGCLEKFSSFPPLFLAFRSTVRWLQNKTLQTHVRPHHSTKIYQRTGNPDVFRIEASTDMVEELNGARNQSGFFSELKWGVVYHCLLLLFFLLIWGVVFAHVVQLIFSFFLTLPSTGVHAI